MPTRKPKPNAEPDVQLLSTSKCPSIRNGGTQITYSIGALDSEPYLKLVGSSGGGQINNSWIPFADILKLLENYSEGGIFNSSIFLPLFENVSRNNVGFVLAIAHKEQLVKSQEGKRTKFTYNNPTAFLAKVDKLIAAKASKPSPRRNAKATT